MSENPREAVEPQLESEVTEENKLLVSLRKVSSGTAGSSEYRVTHNGDEVIISFEDSSERVIFDIIELVQAAYPTVEHDE